MPTTAKYGWTTPTEGGSTGTWDTILNDLFDESDQDLYNVEQGIGPGNRIVLALHGAATDGWAVTTPAGARQCLAATPGTLFIPLPSLGAGLRITDVDVLGQVTLTATGTCKLWRMNSDGSTTQIGASFTLGGTLALVGISALTEDVAADKAYFVEIEMTGATGSAVVYYARLTVIQTP